MGEHSNRRKPRRAAKRRRRFVRIAVALATAAGVVALIAAGSGEPGPEELKETGETSAMGMPVVETPGSTSGTTKAGGVVVTGSNWALGRVPLMVAVRPTWTLRNTSGMPVTLGEARPEVREGCCPGALVLGSGTLAPGASTTLSFELAMHPGMDGPHDIGVHVPVGQPGAPEEMLHLNVTGDFR